MPCAHESEVVEHIAYLDSFVQANKAAIKMFWHRCLDIIDRGLKETELRAFYRDTRWQEACLAPALRKIRALTRGEVDETDTGEAAFRLLSELTVTLPQLVELMQASRRTMLHIMSCMPIALASSS